MTTEVLSGGRVSPPPRPPGPSTAGLPASTSLVGRLKEQIAAVGGPAPEPQHSTAASVLTTALVLMSLSALWLLLYALFFSGLQERSAQHRLYSSIRYSLAEELVPLGGQIKTGTPIAVLSAPDAGITRDVVVEGTTSGVLRDGPGHEQNTPLPGQAGQSVIMGRSVTFGGPFRHIASLVSGEVITVTTGQGVFRYTVTDVRGDGDPLPATLESDASRLTLVTSRGSGWRDGWAPSHTVLVDATLSGQVQPTPSGRPSVIAPNALPMHSDAGGLTSLVLLLQGLLLICAGVVWARLRWGFWQAWLSGAPAILAVVWLISGEALRLLPNLV